MAAGSTAPLGRAPPPLASAAVARKLCLIVVDSLRMDMLRRTVAAGEAPHFGALLDRGELVEDCVSSFPSVTPVCNAEIATGARPGPMPDGSPGHGIMGMNWYHRVEERYVEYGNSLEATRAFGLFRSLYDVVYNLNMSHLSTEVETVFERLGDGGVRTACTPFLVYRGRTRHEMGLEGLLRQVAVAAKFHHATWGPDELFWGELYASRKVPCKPTLARPGTRDEYSGCVGRELLRDDAYDFLLFSLPDNDHHSHKGGPAGHSIALADAAFGELVDEAGGIDAFCGEHAVILTADHAQSDVSEGYDLAGLLGPEWRVLQPNDETPEAAELAVSPDRPRRRRLLLARGNRRLRAHDDVRRRIGASAEADVLCWLAGPDGKPVDRPGVGMPEMDGAEAVVEAAKGEPAQPGAELRFRPAARRAGGTSMATPPPWASSAPTAGTRAPPTPTPSPASGPPSPPPMPATSSSPRPRLRDRGLGRDDPCRRRKPRLTAGRGLPRPTAHGGRRGRRARASASSGGSPMSRARAPALRGPRAILIR